MWTLAARRSAPVAAAAALSLAQLRMDPPAGNRTGNRTGRTQCEQVAAPPPPPAATGPATGPAIGPATGPAVAVPTSDKATAVAPPVVAGMQADAPGDYFNLFPRRQLWQPLVDYPLWCVKNGSLNAPTRALSSYPTCVLLFFILYGNARLIILHRDVKWDGRHPPATGDETADKTKLREIRSRGVTRHIICIRHGQYDETFKVGAVCRVCLRVSCRVVDVGLCVMEAAYATDYGSTRVVDSLERPLPP
jgi:hypothetical protein